MCVSEKIFFSQFSVADNLFTDGARNISEYRWPKIIQSSEIARSPSRHSIERGAFCMLKRFLPFRSKENAVKVLQAVSESAKLVNADETHEISILTDSSAHVQFINRRRKHSQ